jgi:two-component system NtrC family sensor kinase
MIFNLSTLIPAIASVLYIIFTVFGLYQSRRERLHWPFIFYMFLMFLWSFGSFMMHAHTKLLTPLFWNRFMMIGMLGVPITILHTVLDLFEKRRRKYNIFLYVGYPIYAFMLLLNFRGAIVSSAGFEGGNFTYSLGKGSYIGYVLLYVFLILGIVVLFRELYKTKNEMIKKKLRLPLFGGGLMLIGVLVNIYEPIGRYPFDIFMATINAFIIFYAIYKFRLVHYSAFVIRAILYFVLVIISALVFYGIIWGSFRMIREIPFQYSFLLSMFLGVVAAIIFQPLRTGTLSLIERLYFGKRLDYYKNLRAFSDSLTTIVELDLLCDSIVDKLVNTFSLEWALMVVFDHTTRNYKLIAERGLYIEKDDLKSMAIARNSDVVKIAAKRNGPLYSSAHKNSLGISIMVGNASLEPVLILPLKFKEKLNGFICLGQGHEKEYYDQFDLETFDIFAGQCSVALENAISFEKVKRQQKRLQNMNRELIISRNKLEAFFDGITTPISIQDINYNIVTANYSATRYFKTSFDDLVGKKCYKVYFGRNKPCENCMAQDSLHTQLPFSIERNDKKGGIIFSIHFYPISVPMGSERMFLEFFQDITQQKRLQQELIQSEKLAGIGTLASGIAHEINNPLYGIIGTAEIMLEEGQRSNNFNEYIKDIIDYAQNAAEIIKDLTNYSRTEESTGEKVNVIDIIENSLKLAKRGMNFDEIRVRKIYDELPLIDANANELQQVFLNLLINAVQAMKGKGLLTIDARQKEGNAFISISDTGYGIERKNIEAIFNPFFTTKEPGKGTGLGLSIVYQIVYSMGGRIYVGSQIGKGTTFSIILPISKEETKKISFVHVRTESQLEDVFFLQRKILVGEKGYHEESIRRHVDEKAYHIIAYKGLQPVGTVSCATGRIFKKLPIEEHFSLERYKKGKLCVEIDRLAVLREERRSIIPMGLMTLAYLFAKSENAERVFLDVFSDEKKYINMYKKLGFQSIGNYNWLLPVSVMMMDYKTDYEKKSQRMEHFVKPFMSKLVKRLHFEEKERERIMNAVETVIKSSSESGLEGVTGKKGSR